MSNFYFVLWPTSEIAPATEPGMADPVDIAAFVADMRVVEDTALYRSVSIFKVTVQIPPMTVGRIGGFKPCQTNESTIWELSREGLDVLLCRHYRQTDTTCRTPL
jgi:hypothetical protein